MNEETETHFHQVVVYRSNTLFHVFSQERLEFVRNRVDRRASNVETVNNCTERTSKFVNMLIDTGPTGNSPKFIHNTMVAHRISTWFVSADNHGEFIAILTVVAHMTLLVSLVI